jgi:hypothetical protein
VGKDEISGASAGTVNSRDRLAELPKDRQDVIKARAKALSKSAKTSKPAAKAKAPQKPPTPPQPRKAKPGWRIVYRKDPADLVKMGVGGEPPVWIAGEWGCPFRIDPPPYDISDLPSAAHFCRGWTIYWDGGGLGSDRPAPHDLSYHATYFERREGQKAAQRAFRAWLRHPDQADVRKRVREGLRGRRLACLCGRKSPCHGDVLIKIANEEDEKL